jgi:hypothetical protein
MKRSSEIVTVCVAALENVARENATKGFESQLFLGLRQLDQWPKLLHLGRDFAIKPCE